MHGDIVKAAKWLGGCMVVASLILVAGFHPTVTGHVVTFTKVQPETAPSPAAPVPSSACSPSYNPALFAPPSAPVLPAQAVPDVPLASNGAAVSN